MRDLWSVGDCEGWVWVKWGRVQGACVYRAGDGLCLQEPTLKPLGSTLSLEASLPWGWGAAF